MHDDAKKILATHLPGLRAADGIISRYFPSIEAGNRIVGDMGRKLPGPGSLPGGVRTGPFHPSRPVRISTKLAVVIANTAKSNQTAGAGVVDIRAWAGYLEAAGVSKDTILSAYEAAGGDAALAPAEASGNTSGFLQDFVSSLEERGVAPEVIAGTYEQAGGRFG